MRQIPEQYVRSWTKVQDWPTVGSFSTFCPFCAEKVTFSTARHNLDSLRSCVSATSNCPGCAGKIGVWSIGKKGTEIAEVFIYPGAGEPRLIKELGPEISEPLCRSYASTVEAFNSGNYVATAVCCRRTLEGLFQGLLLGNDSKMNLAKSIQKVAESVDLAAPIRNLANVLRQGGNLGAHFDMEKEPDRAMALQMLELLENLIDFLHVLPNEIGNLEKLLDRET
jgi:hypothetical protein